MALHEFLDSSQASVVRESPRPSARSSIWVPPQFGSLKINCDASYKLGEAYFACVVQDSRGAVVQAFGNKCFASSITVAEYLVI